MCNSFKSMGNFEVILGTSDSDSYLNIVTTIVSRDQQKTIL